MSFLNKLLDGIEVEWKPLGDVCKFKNGFAFKSNLFKENGLPIIRITNVDGKNINLTDVKYFNPADYKENIKSYEVSYGDVLIAMSGATTGKIGFYAQKSLAYLNQRVGKFEPRKETLENRYLYHFLLSKVDEIYLIAGGGAQPNLSSNVLMTKILVPIPCPENQKKSLEIQQKIAAILDNFTELTAKLIDELKAELTARKQQYNYYQHKLLSFENADMELMRLNDISDFTYGYAAKAQDAGNARFVRITDINSNGKLVPTDKKFVDISKENERYLLQKNDILMARTGATFGKTMIFEEDYPAIYAGFLIKLNLNKNIINPKYYWHFAQSELFWSQANKLVSGGGQPQFNANVLKKIKMPIPYPDNQKRSLDEQARIVCILDKFDILTSSIKNNLSKEIQQRKKQYSHYRDFLLAFPKTNI